MTPKEPIQSTKADASTFSFPIATNKEPTPSSLTDNTTNVANATYTIVVQPTNKLAPKQYNIQTKYLQLQPPPHVNESLTSQSSKFEIINKKADPKKENVAPASDDYSLRVSEKATKINNKLSQQEQQTEMPVQAVSKPSTTMSHENENQYFTRDKRWNVDMEINQGSLTLAEKLKYEASKYNENNKSDVHSNSSEKNDSDIKEKKKDSVPSSPIYHGTERRPSWRLRIDTGNKVNTRIY